MSRLKTSLSGDGGFPDASKEWSNIEDSEERRRVQNRVAQRKYRARIKKPRLGNRRDEDTFMPAQDLDDSLEQENVHPSSNEASILDQEVSASAPWTINSLQAQDSVDLQNFSYPCTTDYNAMLREHESRLPTSSLNYEYPRLQTPSFVSLQPNSIGNDNNGCSDYKSLPTLPSPYNGTEPNFEDQDYLDAPNTLSNKRRSEVQLPQRERGSSTKEVPRAERDAASISKSSSSSQSKSAHSLDDGSHKNGLVKNRPSKPSRYDTSKDLTKTCEKVQKQLMQQAYEQGRKEARASFGKQRSRLQSKAESFMDAVIETYGSGVRLEVFEHDLVFDKHLQAVKVHLQSLSRLDARAFGGRVSLHDESDSLNGLDTASEDGKDDGSE